MALQNISFDESDTAKTLYVVYRIRGDDLIPQLVTSELNIQPSVAHKKGEKYVGKKYDPITKQVVDEVRERTYSVWNIDSKSQEGLKRVKDHIGYLLNIIEPQTELIQHYLDRAEKYLISFYIRWEPYGEHGSYQIPSELMERMGKLCHYVEFSFIGTFETDQ